MDTNTHHTQNPRPASEDGSNTARLTKKGAIIALIVFLALIALGFMAARSLPGDSLYSIKTQLLEGLNQSVQFSDQDKAAYQVTRMESRLHELQALIRTEKISEERISILQEMTNEHTAAFMQIINNAGDSFVHEDKLAHLEQFAGIAAALEQTAEAHDSTAAFGESAEDIRRDTVNVYEDHVDRFVERETPEGVFEYIRTQLTAVSTQLEDTAVSQDAVDDAEVYIERVGPAVAEGDFPRAIIAIAEAMRFITVDAYTSSDTNLSDTSTSTDDATPATSTATQTIEAEPAEVTPANTESFTFPE